MAVDTTKMRKGLYDVKWNTTDLGGVDAVDFGSLKPIFIQKKIGTMGTASLGEWFDGFADGAIVKVKLKEPSLLRQQLLAAWANQTGGHQLEGTPLIGGSMETLAQALTLHPTDITGTGEDIIFFKTVPDISSLLRKRDNQKADEWDVEFRVYQDQTKRPTANPYFTVG